MPESVQLFEVPVDSNLAGLMRALEIHVPDEKGGWCQIDVTYNVVRDSYLMEFSGELFRQAPQAVTAVVQMAMLAIRDWLGGEGTERD